MTSDAGSNLPPTLRPSRAPHVSLGDLVHRFGGERRAGDDDVILSGVTLSTDDVRSGDLFGALPGRNHHGAHFVETAVAAGAAAVITDPVGADLSSSAGVPIVVVDDPRAVLGEISAWVYGTDENLPIMLGVTGTNGKTSVAHLLKAILEQLGVVAGLSSTAERHIGSEVITSRLTTPEATEFHALLAHMRECGVEAVADEVSAQALTRHRVDGIVFDVAGFTNLTHDHLDDFGDMGTYFRAKLPLFTPERSRRAVVSLDSEYGAEVVAAARVPTTSIITPTLSVAPAVADWTVEIIAERHHGTTFTLHGPDGQSLTTTVPVIGPHMASNAALAIVMLREAGYEWSRLADALDGRRIAAAVPGRTQRVSADHGPAVYVDFGHSPDAFEKTLAAVRRVTPGRVLMLFGADGDRDATKRFDMGRTAALGSDILIITDHHPRYENPDDIRAELLTGARAAVSATEIIEISPPERAIVEAISRVGDGDAILWAGPGHQDYRDIRGARVPYSARELARRALAAAGWNPPAPTWAVPYPPDSTPDSDPTRPA
ncbi:UDP-N-acetylmuramoylalanyl-D-glutamate--2,6-diaminopimelate ligase [Microbacterium sp. AG790]|uniref:Mur ligase family protein n=1 Tax=Microbacterium sp. AG790 TaxID=2183995 RepID=UPI000EABF0E6|nr:UDP-N-acetylmuramoyl-L-alanyl-D-glutamate--2,6-diaminopimelate ligase [Microbacterium sp. AG790]RKS88464.1 UDP-N-acetylmuramoylalanyl-D-glutamate--2,6-diaminopimelate ligase [Microbacterium sp. AG790]